MSKNKTVQFNIEHPDQKKLFDAISELGINFSNETKKLWAKKLNIKFNPVSNGRPKNNESV